jgi:hypothetical protein
MPSAGLNGHNRSLNHDMQGLGYDDISRIEIAKAVVERPDVLGSALHF